MGSGFGSYPRTPAGALRLALFAALGVIFEILVVEEKLLTCSKDKFRAAINTLEYLIREFHGRLPRSREPAEIGHDLECAGPVSLSSYVVQQLGPGPRLKKLAAIVRFPRNTQIETISIVTRRCAVQKLVTNIALRPLLFLKVGRESNEALQT